MSTSFEPEDFLGPSCQTLFDAIPSGIILQDKNGAIFAANPAAQEILGLSLNRIIGGFITHPAWRAIKEDGTPFPAAEFPAVQALRSGQAMRQVVMGVYPPGRPAPLWLKVTAVPKAQNPGQPVELVISTFEDITEAKTAQGALAKSEQHFKELFLSFPLISSIWKLRQDGQITLVESNHMANAATQNRVLEFIGRTAQEIYPDRPDILENLSRCLREKVTITQETAYTSRSTASSGTNIFTYVFVEPDMVMLHSEDITQRRQAEEALRQSEERYKAQYRHFALPAFTWQRKNDDFVIIDCNDKALSTTDGAAASLIGKSAKQLYSDDPRVPADLNACYSSQSVIRHEMDTVLRSTGARRQMIGTYVFVPPDLVVVYAEDITERKQAEEALRQSEARFSTIFHASSDLIGLARAADGVILDANGAMCEAFEVTREQLIGDSIFKANFWDNSPQRGPFLRSVLEKGRVPVAEGQYKTHTGKTGTILASGSLVSLAGEDCILVIAKDITEYRQAELRLRESEERFERILRASPVGICILDLHGERALDCNDALLELTGYSREEIIGASPRELNLFLYPDEQAEWAAAVAQKGQVAGIETTIRRKSGELRYVKFSAAVVDMGEKPLAAVLLTDITSLKQTEATLRLAQSELEQRAQQATARLAERLDLATRSAHIGIWDWDVPKNVLVWDAQMYRVYGTKPEEWGGVFEAWSQRVHPEDRARAEQAIQLALSGEKEYDLQFRIQWADGSLHWLQANGVVIRDAQQQPLRMVGVNYDISERMLAEQALFESREDYRSLVESLDLLIVKVDRDGRYLYANQKASLQQGIPAEEIVGKLISETLPPWVAERQLAKVRQVIDSGQSLTEEIKMEFANGVTKWGRGSIQPVFDVHGKAVQAIVSSMDITEMKLAQQRVEQSAAQLKAANLDLERALRAKSEFMAAMSHELRTPLTGILGQAEMLQMYISENLNEKQLRSLQGIEKSGQRLLKLINEVIDYTWLQSAKTELELSLCSLGNACRAALQAIHGLADEKHQHLKFEINPESILIRIDEQHVRQLLLHLLDNAVKFTPRGGHIGLTVSGLPGERQVKIIVSDTGIGIREEDLPKLFQPFVQLDARLSRNYEGTGLGLALVKALAELHGGRVTVESVFGQGSRFCVYLPWDGALSVDEMTGQTLPAAPDAAQETNAVEVLPAELAAHIRTATINANLDVLLALAAQAAEHAPRLGARLRELAENFRYDDILALIEPKS